MDLKEYISSGILESYVLGEVSAQQKQEVECLTSIYPELKSELNNLQIAIEKVANDNAVNPPKELKEQVLNGLYKEIDQDLDQGVIQHDFTSEKSKKIEVRGNNNTWKLVAAACLVLFLIATTVFLNTQNSNINLAKEVQDLEDVVQDKDYTIDQIKNEYVESIDKKNDLLSFVSDTNTRRIALKGTDLSKAALVNVFWNEKNSRVVLNVNNLPSTPTAKQYQLWAIVDGKPKDMGVLSNNQLESNFIEISKTTSSAAAFAITLEDEGGKPQPNLDQLYVIGNV